MAQNTALQTLIEWCKTHHVFRSSQSETEFYNKATELLPKERQDIEAAVNEGMCGTMDAKEYFNKTFTQNK